MGAPGPCAQVAIDDVGEASFQSSDGLLRMMRVVAVWFVAVTVVAAIIGIVIAITYQLTGMPETGPVAKRPAKHASAEPAQPTPP